MRLVAAPRLRPELSAFTVHVLPICPRPYDQEAAHSWLIRIGRVYALNAERLVGILGLLPFEAGSRRNIALPVEAVLDGSNLAELAVATQLPAARLAEMRPDPFEWTLTHRDVCTVCALCLDEDLCEGRDPYLRTEWRQAWRIFCSTHHVRLLACRMNVVKSTARDARAVEQIDELYAYSGIIESNINHGLTYDPDGCRLMWVIEEMESVIGCAIAGEPPNPFDWGPLTTQEFLQVVHDVMSWALTNFEAFKARPAAEDLPRFIRSAGCSYFEISSRLQPSFDSDRPVRTLSSVNNPAIRCPTLWWAHVLMCEAHRCHNPNRHGCAARQWHLLQSRCPTGLFWLRDRMTKWPAAYLRQHWMPFEAMLWPEQ